MTTAERSKGKGRRERGATARGTPSWFAELAACGLTLVLVVVAMGPEIRERREEARALSCDSLYRMLEDTTRAQLESVLSGGTDRCGSSSGNFDVLACVLVLNTEDENPRNRFQTAFTVTGDTTSSASSCRVGLTTISTNGIRFNQFVRPDSTTSRTFRVVID